MILDIFSRYVVGWMLAEREAAAWAKQLIEETLIKENIQPDQLTMQSDNGPAMKASPVVSSMSRRVAAART